MGGLEGHGRADAILDTDTTNTVGWFTNAFPVRLGVGAAAVDIERAEQDPRAARAMVASVVTQLNEIPNEGLDYGLLRYVDRVPEFREAADQGVTCEPTTGKGRLSFAKDGALAWLDVTGLYCALAATGALCFKLASVVLINDEVPKSRLQAIAFFLLVLSLLLGGSQIQFLNGRRVH